MGRGARMPVDGWMGGCVLLDVCVTERGEWIDVWMPVIISVLICVFSGKVACQEESEISPEEAACKGGIL